MISDNLDLIFVGLATLAAVVSGMLGLRQAKRDRLRVRVGTGKSAVIVFSDAGAFKKLSVTEMTTQIVSNSRSRRVSSFAGHASKKETFDPAEDVLELAYTR